MAQRRPGKPVRDLGLKSAAWLRGGPGSPRFRAQVPCGRSGLRRAVLVDGPVFCDRAEQPPQRQAGTGIVGQGQPDAMQASLPEE